MSTMVTAERGRIEEAAWSVNDGTHTYRSRIAGVILRALVMEALALGAAFVAVWWLFDGHLAYGLLVPLNLVLGAAGVARAMARGRRTTLTISSRGVALYQHNYLVSGGWSDVTAVERDSRSHVLVLGNAELRPYGTGIGAEQAMKRVRRLGLDRRIRLAPFATGENAELLSRDLQSLLPGFPGLARYGQRWTTDAPPTTGGASSIAGTPSSPWARVVGGGTIVAVAFLVFAGVFIGARYSDTHTTVTVPQVTPPNLTPPNLTPPSSPGVTNSWQTFTASDAGFTVDFPGQPTRQTTGMPIAGNNVQLTVYSAETADGGKLVAGGAALPEGLNLGANTHEALQNGMDNSARAVGGTITNASYITFNGYPAVDYTVQGGGAVVHARLLATSHSIYVLTSDSPADYSHFVGSFRINAVTSDETQPVPASF